MTEDPYQSPPAQQPAAGGGDPYGTPPAAGTSEVASPAHAYVAPPANGPIGKPRSTGLAIFLFIITLGIYGWYWYYQTFEEMKRHRGSGLGGAMSLVLNVLGIFVGVTSLVLPYIHSSEVGQLYELRGQEKPVSGLTGLWVFPGILILVGPIIWFVKTNGALNRYWESLGATK
jgi:hypothetical protein